MGKTVPGPPLGDTDPLKDSPPPLKFHKTSAPGKCTTSKLSSPPDFRWGVHNLPLDLLREGKYMLI